MPEQIPYLIVAQAVISTGNGFASAQYQVPAGWTIRIKQQWFTSTGTFQINDIVDSRGVHYTNANQSVPIPSTLLSTGATANLAFMYYITDLTVTGGNAISVNFKDTSGAANTINWFALTEADLPTGSG